MYTISCQYIVWRACDSLGSSSPVWSERLMALAPFPRGRGERGYSSPSSGGRPTLLDFVEVTELLEKGQGSRDTIVRVGPLPGLKGVLPIAQGDFSKNAVANIEPMAVILR